MKYYDEVTVRKIVRDAMNYGVVVSQSIPMGIESYPNIEIQEDLNDNNCKWYKGIPTEKGWYVVAMPNAGSNARYKTAFFPSDIVWGIDYDSLRLGWQKIDPYDKKDLTYARNIIDELRDLTRKLEEKENQKGWVPVKSGLPTKKGEYLTQIRQMKKMNPYFSVTSFNGEKFDTIWKVEAWQEIEPCIIE